MDRGEVCPEKMGGGVRHTSWNPYPISDQNLRFSLPYFRPDKKFDTFWLRKWLCHFIRSSENQIVGVESWSEE